MLNWLKNLKRKDVLPHNVEHDDPVARDIIAECFNKGIPVIATIDDHGNITKKMSPVEQLK